jgi:hypothetical protein
VRHDAVDEDEVDRAVAGDLVGDGGLALVGVVDVGRHRAKPNRSPERRLPRAALAVAAV